MPKEDREEFQKYVWNGYSCDLINFWAKKMKPEDRLLFKSISVVPTNGIEWKEIGKGFSIGRPAARLIDPR